MPGDIEAIGDVVTGGLLARAVEPGAGGAHESGTGTCLNCGAPVSGAFCSACGQKLHIHRTLGEFWHDLAHSVFHFDGKIWRTLPLLAWNPGHLTRRYIHGERAKFVSPFALFLFSVFVMFAVFSWGMPKGDATTKLVTPKEAVAQLDQDRQALRKKIDDLAALRRDAEARKAPTDWIDGEIGRTRALLGQLEKDRNIDVSAKAISQRQVQINRRKMEIEIAQLEAKKAEARKLGQPIAEIDDDLNTLKTGLTVMNAASSKLEDGVFEIQDVNLDFGWPAIQEAIRHASKNPQLLIYKLQSNAYKFSWALIPLSTPFLWLLFFWRREFYLFDHAVFVTYSIAFMMMLATVSVVAIQFSATEVIGGFLLTLYPPFHMYRQLKQAYGLTRFGAIWRTSLLLAFAVSSLMIFLALILSMGLSG
ncbi:DUF3667 domain-containing protein [Chakrabartia godavariana]|nr:DUF3667 domain-containing protein [Chakrabartia godavariana]